MVRKPQTILVPSERDVHVLHRTVIGRVAARPATQMRVDASGITADVDGPPACMHRSVAGAGNARAGAERRNHRAAAARDNLMCFGCECPAHAGETCGTATV